MNVQPALVQRVARLLRCKANWSCWKLMSWWHAAEPSEDGDEMLGDEARGTLNSTENFTKRDALLAQRYLTRALRTTIGRLDAIHLWIWLIRLGKAGPQ